MRGTQRERASTRLSAPTLLLLCPFRSVHLYACVSPSEAQGAAAPWCAVALSRAYTCVFVINMRTGERVDKCRVRLDDAAMQIRLTFHKPHTVPNRRDYCDPARSRGPPHQARLHPTRPSLHLLHSIVTLHLNRSMRESGTRALQTGLPMAIVSVPRLISPRNSRDYRRRRDTRTRTHIRGVCRMSVCRGSREDGDRKVELIGAKRILGGGHYEIASRGISLSFPLSLSAPVAFFFILLPLGREPASRRFNCRARETRN